MPLYTAPSHSICYYALYYHLITVSAQLIKVVYLQNTCSSAEEDKTYSYFYKFAKMVYSSHGLETMYRKKVSALKYPYD